MCPTSNLQTGAAATIADHPATAQHRKGIAISINTDNRLMSGTTATRELALMVEQAGWTLADVRDSTVAAMLGAFVPRDEALDVIGRLIMPGYKLV
jgi:adenosine deaminase